MFRRERSRSDVFALEIAKKHLSLLYKSSLHFTNILLHVVVFTRSSSAARALASTLICCSILQYTKRTKPSADTRSIDPWVRVVTSFLCVSLFQSVCVRVGDDVFLVAA